MKTHILRYTPINGLAETLCGLKMCDMEPSPSDLKTLLTGADEENVCRRCEKADEKNRRKEQAEMEAP